MDNQQVRRLLRIAWLAGIIDGEGSFGIYTRSDRGTSEPVLTIANQDPHIIERSVEVIKELGVGVWVNPTAYKGTQGCRYVRVSGLKRLGALLPMIISSLTAKQAEAELVLRFCNNRLANRTGRGLTDEETRLIAELSQLKKNRNLRDYTPTPDWLSGEDIVQAA